MKRRPKAEPVTGTGPPAVLARCFAEDWLTEADLTGPYHGPHDIGYGDRASVLLVRAWGRYRVAARLWEADHPGAPRIPSSRPLWRGAPPADESPHTGSRAGRF